ncbi:MAG: hypothetical protein U1F56_18075 [Rubrivivax sp.]
MQVILLEKVGKLGTVLGEPPAEAVPAPDLGEAVAPPMRRHRGVLDLAAPIQVPSSPGRPP